ncbi:MAG: molybdopterin-dependent oxidoreductase [Alphaproteobacteria bacterium]|nr:molybdopterin-dependent oxidoreductase [Alphaproteobacteria bacterium]
MGEARGSWIGARLPRKEDPALLTGQARFIDDLEPVAGLRHVAILRSPHAHARITGINTAAAEAMDGVAGVLTGRQIVDVIDPIPSALRVPITYHPIAVDKVRYVGEPVALVAASDRYLAEDALDAIAVDYEPLPAVVDPLDALAENAPLLHDEVGSNRVHHRTFRYGDPDTAFAKADHVVSLKWRYPRQSSTPIETYGIIAHFEEAPERYTVWSNFQGPFILHALMCGALKIPGNRLRLITAPNSGGSFGIKQAMYPYIVLLAAASRLIGAPLKWIEDRLEHLVASSAAADRADEVDAAFTKTGELTGLRFRNIVDVGAYVRAPEPASVYRMHASSNGSYRVRNIAIDNQLVVTNRTPVGLNRGYGGPQYYYALERIIEAGARKLGMDVAEIRRRNFIPADAFPYLAPAGALYDAGDYEAALDEALRLADYDALKAQRTAARAEGRLFGIGLAAGVEPSGSNMAYVTLAQTPEERAKAGGRSGALSSATVSIDPSGAVTVRTVSTPAGQGHATVAAQIVADALGLHPDDVHVVTDIDTLTSAWSLASGNYSNRFSSIVVGAISQAVGRVAEKIKKIAGEALEVSPEDIELVDGEARIVGVPEKGLSVRRLAASTHWHPAGLPEDVTPGIYETAVVSPTVLNTPDQEDRVASSVTFGFICDIAAIEIHPETGRIKVIKYVTVHDIGTVLNPIIVEGQIHGGFAHGLGAALLEELVYDPAGSFQSGTFADYLCPTATEMPPITVGQTCTPSPQNPFGSKGMGDGSSMLTPTVIANAVADALGRDDIELPLTFNKMWDLANGRTYKRVAEAETGTGVRPGPGKKARHSMTGSGSVELESPPETVWRLLLDPEELAALIPGCESLEMLAPDSYAADVRIGVGGIRSVYKARIELRDQNEPESLRLVGKAEGALGWGAGEGQVTLTRSPEGGTQLDYSYVADVGGKVAAVGQRMLGTVARLLIAGFFKGLDKRLQPVPARKGLWAKLTRKDDA